MNSTRMGRRTVIAGALATGAALPVVAQQGPIKIGMSMPLTGGLAAGGKSSLIGIEVWRDDVNAEGRPAGPQGRAAGVRRQVERGSETPAIYSKLLDVDKVDLLFAPYATVPTAPIMPMVKQRDLLLMGNFSFQVNRTVKHDKWFNNAPWGPADSWARGIRRPGHEGRRQDSIALIGADQEFAQSLLRIAKGRRRTEKKRQGRLRAELSAGDRRVLGHGARLARGACRAWSSSAPIRRTRSACCAPINEIGVGESVKVFGGGMVGLQFSSRHAESMGSLLNGVVNYNSYLPEKSMEFPGSKEFFVKYQKRAGGGQGRPAGLLPGALRLRHGPDGRAGGQRRPSRSTTRSWPTSCAPPRCRPSSGRSPSAADGERKESATLIAQFSGVVDKNIEQFRNPGKQVILSPEKWKTGELAQPFEKARKG